jgi:hypothetical protein
LVVLNTRSLCQASQSRLEYGRTLARVRQSAKTIFAFLHFCILAFAHVRKN